MRLKYGRSRYSSRGSAVKGAHNLWENNGGVAEVYNACEIGPSAQTNEASRRNKVLTSYGGVYRFFGSNVCGDAAVAMARGAPARRRRTEKWRGENISARVCLSSGISSNNW